MTLSGLVIALLSLALIGFLVYLIITYIPMPEIFKQVIMVAVAILVILYLLMLLNGGGVVGYPLRH
jgi:hypothetical protein